MLDFVAIDFETANSRADSACQFAAVVFEQGKIVHEASWLIKPPRMYFSPQNIAVHGILPEQVANQPNFAQVWEQCKPLLDGRILVAHNARFDLGVLTSTLATYDIAIPRIDFSCTRLISQRCWPGHISYGLAALAERFEIRFQHHDALEDSRTCGDIAIRAAEQLEARSFDDLEKKLFITRGVVSLGQISSPKTIKRSRSAWPLSKQALNNPPDSNQPFANPTIINRPEVSYGRQGVPSRKAKVDVQVNTERIQALAGNEKPFAGRRIFFTGKLMGLSRCDAMALATSLGATCENEVSPHTDYVIMGQPDPNSPVPTTALAALQSQDNSVPRDKPIRLLSERQFVQLLPGGQAAIEVQIRRRG